MWNGLVDARRARRHVMHLSRRGVGYKSAAAAASVAISLMAEIRSGRRTRIRVDTERRILEVTAEALADHAIVPARAMWARIRRLLGEGFSRAELARRLGYKHPALQLGKDRILAKTAMRVERFYRTMMEV